MNLYDTVYNYPTKNPEGFTGDEINKLLHDFPELDRKMFDDAMIGNTCMVIDGKAVMYHCDILTAIKCGLEHRDRTFQEWD